MKTFITLLLAVILFTACERQSGRRVAQPQPKEIKVKIMDTYPEKIMTDVGLIQYKSKVITEDSVVCYILTNNEFNSGDIIMVKTNNILKN